MIDLMQSSGKSSVLESFVGRDFLPRGSGYYSINRFDLHSIIMHYIILLI